MKAISIGRDQECDIVINDSTDVISRRHAILNISSSGKITIVDQSRNGTYVNGIRISQNVPVPVTKKDIISFAHVAKLDWNAIPTSNSMMRNLILGIITLMVVTGGGFAYFHYKDSPKVEKNEVVATDSTQIKNSTVTKDTIEVPKEENKQKADSAATPKKKSPKGEKQQNKKEEPVKEKKDMTPTDSIKNNRPIG